MTKFLLCSVLLACWLGGPGPAPVRAQLPGEVMTVPRKYAPPVKKPNTFGPDIAPVPDNLRRPDQVWLVYSDRAENPTYTSPGGSTIKGRLDFLDQFFVVDEEGDYIHLFQDDIRNLKRRKLSASAVDFGWIHKDNLLLWRQCLATERSNINQKAMILNTIDHLRNAPKGDESNLVHFWKDPQTKATTGYTSRLYQILYIYKETPEAMLLGKVSRLPREERARKDAMLGWAPKSRLTFWDHRIAFEPNWDEAAVQERRAGMRAQIFVDKAGAQRYSQGSMVSALWDGDPLRSSRPNGYKRHLRFPVLDLTASLQGSPLYDVGVASSLGTKDDDISDIQRDTDLEVEKRRNVNVVFIVDATTSMGDYFHPIIRAIERSMDHLKDTRNTFRFGAAVYRDLAEGRRLFETQRLGTDANVKQFFNELEAIDEYDRDQPEAVFYGIQGALRAVGLTDDGTNVCIVAGDAGNHNRDDISQVSQETVVDLLTQRRCHLLAVQVHHQTTNRTFDEFVEQMKSLAMATAQRLQPSESGDGVPTWRTENGAYGLTNSLFGGWVLGAPRGGSISPMVFQEHVVSFLEYTDGFTNNLIRLVESMVQDGESSEQAMADLEQRLSESWYEEITRYERAVEDVLRQAGVSRAQIETAREKNYQLYTEGVVPMAVEGQQYPLFKRVLLFSRDELAILFSNIQQLADVRGSNSDQRKQMMQVWTQILKNYVGEQGSYWEELSLEEIHAQVFGLPGGTRPFLRNVKLQDIEDRRAFSDAEFGKYMDLLFDSSVALSKIQNAPFMEHPYQFRSHEEVYYWIDEELIP